MRSRTTLVFLFALLLCTSIVSAVELPLQGTVLNSTNGSVTGDLRVYVYNATPTLIYDSGTDFNGAIVNGSYSVVLGRDQVLNLVHGAAYSLDLAVNGEDLDFNGQERQNFTAPVGTYTDTDTDTNTLYYADGVYIYNNGSDYFYLNESMLNATIDLRADGTGGWINDSTSTTAPLNVNIDGYLNVSTAGSGIVIDPLWTSIEFGPNVSNTLGAFSMGEEISDTGMMGSFAMGRYIASTGIESFSFGELINNYGSRSLAFGFDINMSGSRSFAFGEGFNVSGNSSIAFSLNESSTFDCGSNNTFCIYGGTVNITSENQNAQLCLNNDCRSSWPAGGAGGDGAGWTNDTTWTNTTLHVNVSGNVSAAAICINGDCREAWPAGFASKGTNDAYLFNDTTNIYLNESALNDTIDARADGTGGWTNDSVNTSTSLDVVVTNGSIMVTNSSAILGYWENHNINNSLIQLVDALDSMYIGAYSLLSTNPLELGTLTASGISFGINDTEIARFDTDGNFGLGTTSATHLLTVNGSVNITNASSDAVICLNDDCRSSWPVGGAGDGTGGWNNNSINTSTNLNVVSAGNMTATGGFFTWLGTAVQRITNLFVTNADINGTLNVSGTIVLNGTSIDDWSDIAGGSDTQKTTSGAYLSNDSTTIYFNESLLNTTINALDDDTTYSVSDMYVLLSGTVFSFNESKLNDTIDARAGVGTSYNATGYLYNNGSNVFFLNETYLNATIDARDEDNDTTYAASGAYINLVTTTFSLNETALNNTIDARALVGSTYNASGYLYNNGSNYFLLNETQLNATIDARDTDTTAGWANGTGTVVTTFNVTIGDILTLAEITNLPGSCSAGEVAIYNTTGTNYPCFCNGTDWVKFENYSATC